MKEQTLWKKFVHSLFSDKDLEVERRVVASTSWEELEKTGGDIVLLMHAKNFDPQKFPEFSNCFEVDDMVETRFD